MRPLHQMTLFVNGFFRLIGVCLLIFTTTLNASNPSASEPQQQQVIDVQLRTKDATRAYVAWALEDWSLARLENQDPDSFISEGLLYTPLIRQNDHITHSGQIQAPSDQRIRYKFWIDRLEDGSMADRYYTATAEGSLFLQSESGSPITLDRTQPVEPATRLMHTPILWDCLLLGGLAALSSAALCILAKCIHPKPAPFTLAAAILSLSAYAFHILIRIHLSDSSILHAAPHHLRLAYCDWVYIAALTAFFILIGWVTHQPYFRRLLLILQSLLLTLSLAVAVLNISVVQEIGRAFNYRWLYYSGFLQSAEAKSALTENLQIGHLLPIPVIICSMLLFAYGGTTLFRLIGYKIRGSILSGFGIVLLILPGFIPPAATTNKGMLENPIVAFFTSFFELQQRSPLIQLDVPAGIEFGQSESVPPELPEIDINHIIVVVLESTGARYLDLYGGTHAVSPHLNAAFSDAVLFENIYAHAPSTNKSLVSLLCSIYPLISYKAITSEQPDLKQASLPSTLRDAGYRTAFFTSADYTFQNSDRFIHARGFDSVSDYRSIPHQQLFQFEGQAAGFGIGIDDNSLVDALFEWIELKPSSPSMSVLWTNQAHYPYFVQGDSKDFQVGDMRFNRYLNALAQDDAMIGRLIEK